MIIPDWITSLSHLVFLSVIIYLWKSKSKIRIQIATILILSGCLLGTHWIFISLTKYGGLNYFIATLATLLLAAYVASYYLIAGAIIRRFKLSPLPIASVVCLAEWLKSNFLTGFPWLNIGVFHIDSVFSVFAPFLGSFGVGFIAVYFAALISHSKKITLIAAVAICFVAASLDNFVNFIEPNGEKLNVALIQGAISQSLKFDPVYAKNSQQTHLNLIKAAIQKTPELKLIVLPETALTKPFENINTNFLLEIEHQLKKNNAILMTGIPKRTGNDWKNSLIAIEINRTSGLNIFNSYDKHHLVPFGEYVPWGFKWFVNMMKIPLGEFQNGENPQLPIKVQDQLIGVNICFEDLFGSEISSILFQNIHEKKPSILLNISNLAWFGNTNALDYHLKASRMRSLETGRPMLRATNTGITASIDHKGRVIKKIEPMKKNFLITQVQGTSGKTLYTYFGDYLILVFSMFVLTFTFFFKKKSFYKTSEKKAG